MVTQNMVFLYIYQTSLFYFQFDYLFCNPKWRTLKNPICSNIRVK